MDIYHLLLINYGFSILLLVVTKRSAGRLMNINVKEKGNNFLATFTREGMDAEKPEGIVPTYINVLFVKVDFMELTLVYQISVTGRKNVKISAEIIGGTGDHTDL